MTKVAILWHMHQPFYEDMVTGEHILPWVRLHALKDYYGMVALLREFPNVHMTFNLVPSLLVQLEAFAEDRAKDRDLELSMKPAADLTDGEVSFILDNFFHAQRQRMIDVHPRYAELLAKRGGAPQASAEGQAAARRFSEGDLRDLQVWHKLAWLDPSYLEGDSRVGALLAKGRDFSEDDKLQLRRLELELLNAVIPEYRAAAERGQIELATSPFYHPILPLLCDSDIYLRTHPDSFMPRRRFSRPDDAVEQLAQAVSCHERLFGRRPVGLWPSEGSVSDAMLPLVAGAGFKWMATDEMILARTLGLTFTRDSRGHVEQPERLYIAYQVGSGQDSVTCAFRDHVLSDLIGFTYAGWPADAAADDMVGRLAEAGRRYQARTSGGEATIPVILDGENAWEHFEGGGRPFLRALYHRLSSHPELRTVTMAEACTTPAGALPGIFPGSWIDANFYIWIGHPDDQRAWSQLAEARQALDEAPEAEPVARAQAYQELLTAEGSDWFWWYGDDHSSAHDLEFDDLFRRHVRNVYRFLGKPIPEELFVSNISTGGATPTLAEPTGLLSPSLDGEESSYFEWLGAGTLEIRDVAGAMHQIEATRSSVTLVHFGFDRQRLYVRIDASRAMADFLAEGYELSLEFLEPAGLRFSVRQDRGRPPMGTLWERQPSTSELVERPAGGAAVAAGSILELAILLSELKLKANDPVAFFVVLLGPSRVELERHPAYRPIEARVPDEEFEARNWTA